MPQNLRNGLIVLALALVVWLVPGGGDGASALSALFSIAFTALIAWVVARLYRDYRMELFGLGDRMRGLLYGCVGVAIFAMAARPALWTTGGGTLLWIVMIGGASYGAYVVWRHYKTYSF